jgi:hypothetical protein
MDFWSGLVLAALATWRLTHLLAHEDGPGGMIAGLRARLGAGWAGGLMDCFYCLSLWVAAPMAFAVATSLVSWLLAWLALSGAACLLARLSGEPVVIQALPEATDEGERDGMLRAETRHTAPPTRADAA